MFQTKSSLQPSTAHFTLCLISQSLFLFIIKCKHSIIPFSRRGTVGGGETLSMMGKSACEYSHSVNLLSQDIIRAANHPWLTLTIGSLFTCTIFTPCSQVLAPFGITWKILQMPQFFLSRMTTSFPDKTIYGLDYSRGSWSAFQAEPLSMLLALMLSLYGA